MPARRMTRLIRGAQSHLALVLALLAVGLVWSACQAEAEPALAASPRLVQEDLVTGDASDLPSANAWGAQGDRLVRAPDGDLYTTYVTDGTDSDHRGWVLAERSNGSPTWRAVASGVTATEPGNPPSVLLSPSGTVLVVTISPWDSAGAGAPQIWSSASDTTTVIPGHWLTGIEMQEAGALYPSASIDSIGNVYVWEDVPCPYFTSASRVAVHCQSANVPGTYYWAYRTASDGQWHPEQWESAYRQAYNFLLPESPSDFRVVGTRDILQAPGEAPYECPNGTGYCFDQVLQAQWSDLNEPATSTIVARAAVDAPGYVGDHRASAEDAYVDSQGRTHILASVVDASTGGTYEDHQLVVAPNGAVTDVQYDAVPYPNLSRIVQDTTGRFWLYSVGPSLVDGHHCDVFIAAGVPGDASGTQFGPATVLPFAGGYDCGTEGRNFDVSVRSGTELADYIDGVVATNGGQDWVHYRIALTTGAGTGPAITSGPALPVARAGRAYDYSFTASGGDPPYTWSIPESGLGPPAGLSLGLNGSLAGIPTVNRIANKPEVFTFDVAVTDAVGITMTGTFQLAVAPEYPMTSRAVVRVHQDKRSVCRRQRQTGCRKRAVRHKRRRARRRSPPPRRQRRHQAKRRVARRH